MSKHKQFSRVVVGVRQPSFLEGAARTVDFLNVLGNEDYKYFASRYGYFARSYGTYVIGTEITGDLLESSVEQIFNDYEKIGGDLRSTASKLEQKYHKRLQAV